MSYDRTEWRRTRQREANGAKTPDRSLEHLTRQAHIAASVLTKDPKWDQFLQLVAARKELAESRLEQVRNSLTAPMSPMHVQSHVQNAREQAVGYEAVIAELEYVMGLPKKLMEEDAPVEK